ncbi:hypothetical protein CHLNCDRAFT_133253 [Chlorella variabilis]|uniref:2'-phosphotransferase n=1 Tax=Chlorella variabilis TaxID=554065 RepID=E1Z2P9_CHLVA|nr:hypothetical protein CHLNCDRAFT_133253 [Chlorella variabilis]EFN60036.1 hypothetical protein CHLNCDRAFT_133253 [Chlorella variabilis]|eukprot:XP_005852138.1 hypothetical protein CHLNCDRAFT_133253 [Chlorella variabilis]
MAGSSQRAPSKAGGGGGGGERQDDRGTALSQEMAQHLRHDPPDGMDGCGYVPVGALVRKMEQETSEEEIKAIAEADDKGRYQLGEEGDGKLRVRAVQGHSVPLKNPPHYPIRSAEELPLALHATSPENWEKIQESGELQRMSRTHIHFASEPKHLRNDDWVDLRGAIQAGIPFCRAANNVVLSEGPIPLQFVRRIRLRDLPEEWQRAIPNRDSLMEKEEEEAQTGGFGRRQ